MRIALIGTPGMVSSALLSQATFDGTYDLRNPLAMAEAPYDLVICAGGPEVQVGTEFLDSVRARRFLLISTTRVYPIPCLVDEDTPVGLDNPPAELERAASAKFGAACAVVRLPELFGPGIKQNFIYDLISNPVALRLTHSKSEFQFYDVSRLWHDLRVVLRSGCPLVNFATAPVRALGVAVAAFDLAFHNETDRPPIHCDVRTKHAGLFGASGHYMRSPEQVLHGIAVYARAARRIVAA